MKIKRRDFQQGSVVVYTAKHQNTPSKNTDKINATTDAKVTRYVKYDV